MKSAFRDVRRTRISGACQVFSELIFSPVRCLPRFSTFYGWLPGKGKYQFRLLSTGLRTRVPPIFVGNGLQFAGELGMIRSA